MIVAAVVISLKKWLWGKRTPSNVKCQQSQSTVRKADDVRGLIEQFRSNTFVKFNLQIIKILTGIYKNLA